MEKKDRWQHLVQAAFLLEEQDATCEGGIPAPAVALVDSALEVFTPDIDPVEDFEGYAVRRLLLALRAAFTERKSGDPTS